MRKRLVGASIAVVMAAGLWFLQTDPDASKGDAETTTQSGGPEKLRGTEVNNSETTVVAEEEEPHAADCAHCAANKTSAEAEPTLHTKPGLDRIFKDLAAQKDRIIPKSTFDFFLGSEIGAPATVEVAGHRFSGKISVVRENDPMARSYGMALDDGLGALLISTDGGGFLRGHLLFIGDSRAITFQEIAQRGSEPSQLAFYESRVSDVFCAEPDAVYAGAGVSSALKGGFPTPTATKDSPIPSAPVIPSFQSVPGADFVLYIDFDGEVVTNTLWNVALYSGTSGDIGEIIALPQARADEEDWVRLVWERVAEDFAPFNLNVTTDRSVYDATDPDKRVMALVTSSTTVTQGAGGVAFTHSFREDSPLVWVVNSDEAICASTISHEAGHAFGLSHDALVGQTPPDDYYFGHNGTYDPGWAPIMGAFFGDGFDDEVDQWSIGEYTNANNQEDDLAILADTEDPQLGVNELDLVAEYEEFGDGQEIYDELFPNGVSISNGFGYKTDDFDDSYTESNLGTFTMLAPNTIESQGLISTSDDIDVFEFTAPEGLVRLTVSPIDVNSIYSERGSETSGANLAVDLLLRDADGNAVAAGLPSRDNLLSSVIETDLDGGTYYLEVDGGGRGADGATGFTDYGSLGRYFVYGELDLPPLTVFGGAKQTEVVFNGGNTVQETNGTDFGYTVPGSAVENIFLLENLGTSLDIEDITVTFLNGEHFELGAMVATGPIQPETRQELAIRYASNGRGVHEDQVIIQYEAGGTQTYRFAVRGVTTISATEDNYEPNNNEPNAFDLNLAEDVWLSDWQGLAFFGPTSPRDFYSFTTTPGDELVRVSIENVSGGDLNFELYYRNNGKNVLVGSSSSLFGVIQVVVPESLVDTALTYFIRVETNDPVSFRNEYDLKWTAVPFPTTGDDLYEENDNQATAYDLTNEPAPRLSENLGLGVLDDEDWYRITIPADPFNPFNRMLHIAAEFDNAQGNIDLQVFRDDELVGFSSTTSDREVVTIHEAIDLNDFEDQLSFSPSFNNIVMGLESGTYFIRVFGDFNAQSYDLVVEPLRDDRYEFLDSGEENDTQANAFPLGDRIIGSSLINLDGVGVIADYPASATATEFVTDETDLDWYSFTLPEDQTVGQIQVNYTSIDGGTTTGVLDFSIVDAGGNILTSTGDGSLDPGILTLNAPGANQYWIRVQAESDQAVLTGYDLGVTLVIDPPFVEEPVEDNYEQNDNFLQLYNITNNEGRWLSGVDGYGTQLDADWFEIAIPANVATLEATLFHFETDGDMDLSLSSKEGPLHFVADDGGDEEKITWEDPIPGRYALTVTGQNRGNFYNLLWDLTFSEDNYEDNDSLAEAFDLTGNERRSLSKLEGTGIQQDEDWYRIEAGPDSAELRVTATFSHDEGDIDIALYNASGSILRRSISSDDNESIVYPNPPVGEYFVRVYFGNEGNEYDLSWASLSQAEIDAIPVGDDAYELNNTQADAYQLTRADPRLSSSLGSGIQKDDDWFTFEVPSGNVGLYVEATFLDAEGDIDFELYDPLGFPIVIRDSITDNEVLDIDRPVPPGNYQLRVYGPNLGNEYDLFWVPYVEDRYEENDRVAEAFDISALLGAPLAGSPTLGDEDWYSFEVNRATPFAQIDLAYINANGTVALELFDQDLNVLSTLDTPDDLESVLLEIQNGRYYIRVYSDGPYLYNLYQLTVTIFGDDEFEENDIAGDAADITATPEIDAVQFDEDWFKFEVTEANAFLSVIASFDHDDGNIDLAFYEEEDLINPIATSATTRNSESVRVEGTVGTYYVQITGDNTNADYQLLWTVSPDDAFEQNDELAEATDLSGGNGLSIEGIQFDEDWFEVKADPGNLRLVAELEYKQVAGNLNLTLFDATGAEVAFEDTETDNENLAYSLFPFNTTPDTYYLRVSGVNTGAGYTLTWSTSNEDNFEGELGNNLYSEPSKDLLDSEGLRISSTIGYGGSLNEDWYEVRINPDDEGIVIEAFFNHSDEGDVDLELYSASEFFLKRSIGKSNVERIHYKGEPGTYYLRVFGKLGGNPYDLIWNSYKEDNLEIGVVGATTPSNPPDNDAPDTPRSLLLPDLNLSERGSRFLGFVKLDELTLLDEDWYLVEIEEGDEIFIVDLEFEHARGDIDVALYDAERGDLIAKRETETDNENIRLIDELPEGEYLICVYGYGIVSPKADPGWLPGSFDPFTDDYSAIEENADPSEDYYDLAEENAHGLANTYTLRWVSTVEDEFDASNDDSATEENDSLDFAAKPPLINQFGVLDPDDAIDDEILSYTENDANGIPQTFQYRSVYTYDLTQLDDDWFEFTVDTGGVHELFVSIVFSSFYANLDLYLYAEDGTLIDSATSPDADVHFLEANGSGRTTYFVRVVGENLGTPYELKIRGFFDDLFEENDNTAEANVNALNDSTDMNRLRGIELRDLFVLRDVDLYRVDIPEDQVHLEFQVTSQIQMDVEVLDASGTVLPAGFEESGGSQDTTNYSYGVISPEANSYYLSVSGSESGFTYGISWNYDNIDQYEGLFANNDDPASAAEPFSPSNLTRLRLEPPYDPDDPGPLDPIKQFAFDYGLLSGLTLGNPGNDPFGHAIQESEDWYHIQIPSWFLTSARRGNDTIQVLKRQYFARLSAEIEFEHIDGDINLEIYDGNDLGEPLARSETANNIESLFARIDPTDEARSYYLRVYGDNAENDYSLKWDVTIDDAYEKLEDNDEEAPQTLANDTNNFIDLAYNLTNADLVSTEQNWLHEIEYLQDVNGDGVINAADGGFTSALGYGIQTTDDWYAVVVSEGATQLEVQARFYSDNDTGYSYGPDDLDIDFEVYYLAGNDGDEATFDLRKPVLIGRSTEDTDETLFSDAGDDAEALAADITTEIEESATFDVDGAGIYFVRVYYDNRAHPYTFYWDDIGDIDNSGDAAIVDDFLNGDWAYLLPDDLPSAPLVAPSANLDGDRFPNWAEFALGLDQSVQDYAVIGQSIAEVDGEQYYQFEFYRNREAEALGYQFIVQESEDLNFGAQEAVHVKTEAVPGSLDLVRVVYRASAPIDEQNRCFFRLVVKEPATSK